VQLRIKMMNGESGQVRMSVYDQYNEKVCIIALFRYVNKIVRAGFSS